MSVVFQPAKPALAAVQPPPEKPFVVLADARRAEKSCATLAEAVAYAGNDATIEIRGDGPFVSSGIPPITGRRLTIRAGPGTRPVLRWEDEKADFVRYPKGGTINLNFLSTNSDLILEGLELQAFSLAPPPNLAEGTANLVQSWPPGCLYVANCRFRLPLFQNVTWTCDGLHHYSPVGVVRNCEFVGQGQAFSVVVPGVTRPTKIQLQVMDNCVIATGSLRGQWWQNRRLGSACRARLTHNTFTNPVAFDLNNFSDHTDTQDAAAGKPFAAEANGNVFDCDCLFDIKLLGQKSIRDQAAADSYVRSILDWQDRDNVYGAATKLYLTRGADHQSFWGKPAADSRQGPVLFQGGDLRTRAKEHGEDITAADFRLKAGSAGKGAGPDGRDLGADVDLVGPGPAYERWKKTPAYQEWLKETGQLKNESAADKPFVVLARGGVERPYANLADAVAGATSGDTVEIRGDGPFVCPPIYLLGKALTIRAGANCRPVLRLEELTPGQVSLLRTESNLTLEGLELQAFYSAVPPGYKGGASLVHVLRRSQGPVAVLHVTNCRFWLPRPRAAGNSNCIFAIDCNVVVKNCEFYCPVGSAMCFAPRTSSKNTATLDNCVSATNYFLILNGFQNWTHLTHNTFAGPSAYLLFKNMDDPKEGPADKRFTLETIGNLFESDSLFFLGCPGEKNKDQAEAALMAESLLRPMIDWQPRANLYGAATAFYRLGDSSRTWYSSQTSLEAWNRFWPTADADSRQGPVLFQGGDLRARVYKDDLKQLTPADFQLKPGSAGKGAGEGGRDLGADVDLVGPGPAYERWKKTPAYQQWLKDTGQSN